jgi:hypothetical protein
MGEKAAFAMVMDGFSLAFFYTSGTVLHSIMSMRFFPGDNDKQ